LSSGSGVMQAHWSSPKDDRANRIRIRRRESLCGHIRGYPNDQPFTHAERESRKEQLFTFPQTIFLDGVRLAREAKERRAGVRPARSLSMACGESSYVFAPSCDSNYL